MHASPRSHLAAWAVALVCVGCANLDDASAARRARTRETIALLDPAFGGAATLERRLLAESRSTGSAMLQQREAFLASTRMRADADALALARELVPDALVDAIGDFLASPTAASAWSAESSALARFAHHGDDFFTRTSELFADPARCGRGAQQQLAELQAMIENRTGSPSPSWVAILVAAQSLGEADARALAGFQRTPAAAPWLAARTAAFLRSQPRFANVLAEAREHGLPRRESLLDELPDLVLPRAQFAPEPASTPALTFVVDHAGVVRCGDVELPDVSRRCELLEALRALRERMLADGSLHLHRRANDPIDSVAEAVTIRTPANTPWFHIGTLMELLATTELAFWTVELATGPEPQPEPPRMPR